MDCQSTATLIGVIGTALGASIISLFAYLSKKSERRLFVKRMRVERIFQSYEHLLGLMFLGCDGFWLVGRLSADPRRN